MRGPLFRRGRVYGPDRAEQLDAGIRRAGTSATFDRGVGGGGDGNGCRRVDDYALARSAHRAPRRRPLADRRGPPRRRSAYSPAPMRSPGRIIGLLRSLAIYHAIPLRQRRMRRFYAQFVSSGDLVFDLGAHIGNRTRSFAATGCRVVAVEPQPDFARLLRLFFARSSKVEVIEAAVGSEPGHTSLFVSERTPT